MADVVELVSKPVRDHDEVTASVIRILEGLLAEAKAGEITGMAVVTVNLDGTSTPWFSTTTEYTRMLGSITHLQLAWWQANNS